MPTTSSSYSQSRFGFASRLCVLTGHTFTQLVRMKIFYFMLVFCVILFAAGFLLSSISPDQELKLLKDTAYGVMQIFSAVFGIVGMSLLLPKDLEDRTLYTILSKPVRRWEYLLSKYLGVVLVLAVCLAIMNVLSVGVLQLKLNLAIEGTLGMYQEKLDAGGMSQQDFTLATQDAIATLRQQGPQWFLLSASFAVLLKAMVATAVALLVSTFAGSTIFTILVSLSFYVAGHVQASARESLLRPMVEAHQQTEAPAPPGILAKLTSAVISVAFPDFQAYNMVDAIVAGKPVPGSALVKISGLTAVYLLVYLGLASFLFSTKEL